MKKVLIVVLALASLVVGALLAAPVFVDWNAYRRDVAAALVQATGREVTIAGDMDLSVFPLPHLTVRQVSVASIQGAVDPHLLRIGELRLELAVAPLLKRQLTVRSLSVVDPVLSLETTADGRRSWDLSPAPSDEPAGRLASAISFETVSVSNGVLNWRAAGETSRRLDMIDAAVVRMAPTGAIQIRGIAEFNGVPVRLAASAGRPDSEDPSPFSATIDVDRTAGRLAATGRIDWDQGLAHGTVRVSSPNANALGVALIGRAVPGLPEWTLSAESAFSFEAGVLDLPAVTLTIGELRAAGLANLVVDDAPTLTVRLLAGAMNLDQLITAAAERERSIPGPDNRGLLAEIFGPGQVARVELDLSIRTARWRGGVVRDIGATARFGPQGWAIDRFAMRLPGGTDVTVSDMETVNGGVRQLQGDLAVISDNLRGALAWIGAADDHLPPDRLRTLSFTSRIAVTPDAVRMANIAAKLDATRISGAATFLRQSRPSFGLRLDLDRLDLGAYLPRSMRSEGSDTRDWDGIATAGLFDANVVLSVETMTLDGTAASQLSLDAQLFDGDLLLRRLSVGDIAGAALALSGTVQDVANTPTGDLNLVLEARDAKRFATFLNATPGPMAARIGGFRLDGRLSGTAHSASVSGTLAVAGGEIRAEGKLADLDQEPAFEFALAGEYPDSDKILGLVLPERPYGGIGPMAVTFHLAGTAQALAVRDLEALLGDTVLSGTMDISYDGERPSAIVRLKSGRFDTDQIFPAALQPAGDTALASRRGSARWSRLPMDLSLLRAVDLDLSLSADTVLRGEARLEGMEIHAELADGVLTVDRVTGDLFGGNLQASCTIDATASSPEFGATIDVRDVAAQGILATVVGTDRLEGPLSFSLSLSATGPTPFDLVSSLKGNGTVSGSLRALRRGSEPVPAGAAGDAFDRLLKTLAPTRVQLSGVLDIADGIIRTGNLLLDGDATATRTDGMLDLTGWRIVSTTTVLRDGAEGDLPELVIVLNGSIDDPVVRLSGTAVAEDPDAAPVPEASPVTPVESVAPSVVRGRTGP